MCLNIPWVQSFMQYLALYELHKPPKFIFWSKLQFLCRKMKFGRKKHTIHHAKFGVDSERVKLKN